jgi:hypothetical protein
LNVLLLLYIGSAIIILWGIAHLVPTRAIVKGFGGIVEMNRGAKGEMELFKDNAFKPIMA